jgi:hypothetical protein
VTGIASGLEDNSSQSSTAKANLSAVESFCSSGIFSLIIWTKLPYSGPSHNRAENAAAGTELVVCVLMQACDDQTSIRYNRPTMAWANSLVDAVPPKSPVRTLPSFSV